MNHNQQNFLDELADLLDKYSIDCVCVSAGTIRFISNGSGLAFRSYDRESGTFDCIDTFQPDYRVK